MNRREFLQGVSAAAVAVAIPAGPAAALYIDVPGTDMAIVGESWMVDGWRRVFNGGRHAVSDDFMRRLTVAPWEYIVSPNYKGDIDAYLPTLEKWLAGK